MLRIGARIKYTSNQYGDEFSNPSWNGKFGKTIGTVIKYDNGYSISKELCNCIEWDNGSYNTYADLDLELIDDNINHDWDD